MQENVALRDARLLHRKTQKEVADVMGVSLNAYTVYERAERVVYPTADRALIAAKFLGGTVEDFFSPANVRDTDNDDAEADRPCN